MGFFDNLLTNFKRAATQTYEKNKSAYQQNLADYTSAMRQQQQENTTRNTLGKIYLLDSWDHDSAQNFLTQFEYSQKDPTSQYYDPFSSATNKAVSNLAAYGFNVNNLTDDWFNQNNSWISQNLLYNGTTNTPSKPGKKSTTDQKIAYELYQYQKSEADTKKAETQWQALQDELTYWAKRKDRNYSDDQILGKIDWSKYGMLTQMDDYRKGESYSPKEYNRAIGYSKDAMYGVMWAARNNGGTGDLKKDMAMSALGQGNVWKENKDITAKLNDRDENTFSPYQVGMTLEEEGLYFGVDRFDDDTIKSIRKDLDTNDATEMRYFQNVVSAHETTKDLQNQLQTMREDIDSLVDAGWNAEDIISAIKDTSDYSGLFKLDASMKNLKLVPTTQAIDYKWENIEQEIRGKVEQHGQGQRITDTANDIIDFVTQGKEPGAAPPSTPSSVNAVGGAAKVTEKDVNIPNAKSFNIPKSIQIPDGVSMDMIKEYHEAKYGFWSFDDATASDIQDDARAVANKGMSQPIYSDSPTVTDEDILKYLNFKYGWTSLDDASIADFNEAKLEVAKQKNIAFTQTDVNAPAAAGVNTPASYGQNEATIPGVDMTLPTGTNNPTAAITSTGVNDPAMRGNKEVNIPGVEMTKPTTATTTNPTGLTTPKTLEQEKEDEKNINLSYIAPILQTNGTPEEKSTMTYGGGESFANASAAIQNTDLSEEEALLSVKKELSNKAKGYPSALKTKREYEDTQAYLETKQKELEDVNFQIKKLTYKAEANGNITQPDVNFINGLNENGWVTENTVISADTIREAIMSDSPSEQYKGYSWLYNCMNEHGRTDDGDFEDAWANQFGIRDQGSSIEAFVEGHPQLKEYANLLINGIPESTSSLNRLTYEEEQLLQQNLDTQEMLQDIIADVQEELDAGKAAYDEAILFQKNLKNDYAMYSEMYGVNVSDKILDAMETFDDARSTHINYPHTSYTRWEDAMEGASLSNLPIQRNALQSAVANAQGADTIAALQKSLDEADNNYKKSQSYQKLAAETVVETTQALEELKRLSSNEMGYGIENTDQERQNVQSHIDAMEVELQHAAWYLQMTSPDFLEKANQGKAAAKSGNYSALTKKNVEALLNGDSVSPENDGAFLSQFVEGGQNLNMYAIVDAHHYVEQCMASMTDDEKNLYFYKLIENGEDDANQYLQTLVNPVNGMIQHRVAEGNREHAREYASENGGQAFASWLRAFASNFLGGIEGWLVQKRYELSGTKNWDPDGIAFFRADEADAMRQGVNEYIASQVGDSNAETVNFFMNALNSAGDSTINAIATSGAFKLIGGLLPAAEKVMGFLEKAEAGEYGKLVKFGTKALDDWAHSIPMAVFASNKAYREYMTKGTPEQAEAMARATFWAESISEAITVGNIRDMWDSGATGETVNLLTELFKNGLEEAVGEGFNQWWEDHADTTIMGSLSNYKQMVESLVASRIPRSRAEELANQEMVKNIAIAAASGFVSSIASTTGAYIKGDISGAKFNDRVQQTLQNDTRTLGQADLTQAPDAVAPLTSAAVNPEAATPASLQTEYIDHTKDEVKRILTTDTAKLQAAQYNTSLKGSAVTVSAVLNNNHYNSKNSTKNILEGMAASKSFVENINQGRGETATRTLAQILSASGNNLVAAKEGVTYASLTNGLANRTLQDIAQKSALGERITTTDVNELLSAVKSDQTGPNAMQNKLDREETVMKYRVAEREQEILARNESVKPVKDAQQAAIDAKKAVDTKAKASDEAAAKVEAVNGALQEAVQDQLSAPAKEKNGPVEQKANELEGAIADQNQADTELRQAEEKAEKTKKAQEEAQQKALSDARTQAQAEIDQEVAAENEAAAQASVADQEAYNTAVQALPPKVGFGRIVEGTDRNGNAVQVTGVYDVVNDGFTIVYTTADGRLITSDAVSGEDLNIASRDASDQHIDNVDRSSRNRQQIAPRVYFPMSMDVNVNGQPVQMIGIVGKTNSIDGYSDPVIMDINGNIYSSNDEALDAFDAIDDIMDAYEPNAQDLPVIENVPTVPTAQTEAIEQEVTNDDQRSNEEGLVPEADAGIPVQGTGTEGNNQGELAPASGLDGGLRDNSDAGSDGGEEVYGVGEKGIPGTNRPSLRRVRERLLSQKIRNRLKRKGVSDLNLQDETDPERFSADLESARAHNSHSLFVDPQSPQDLIAKGAIMFRSADGKAVGAVGTKGKYEGDIFAVAKDERSKAKNASRSIIIQAVNQGGNKLDCYNGTKEQPGLPRMYSSVGMIPVARVAWNDSFHEDDGWNYERDKRPDVVFWYHNGDSAETISKKYKKTEDEGGYHLYNLNDIAQLPLFNDMVCPDAVDEEGNPLDNSYDIAWRYRDNMLAGKYSDDFIAYPGGNIMLTDWANNKDVTIVGVEITDSGTNYVTLDGESIPSTNFNGGTNSNDANPNNAPFMEWVTQKAEELTQADVEAAVTQVEEEVSQVGTELAAAEDAEAITQSNVNATPTEEGVTNIQALRNRPAQPTTPTTQQSEKTKEIHSPAKIAKKLAKALGIGDYIGTSKFGDVSAMAYFDRHSDSTVVKTKYAGDYTTTMHELGHAIAKKFGLQPTAEMMANFQRIDPSFFNGRGYSASELPGEAIAEFMWRYLEGETQGRDFAGDQFYDEFEATIQGMPEGKAIAEARDELQQWLNAEAAEKVGSVIRNRSDKERIPLRQRIREAINALIDNTAAAAAYDNAIQEMENEAAEKEGRKPKKLSVMDSVRAMAAWANTAGKQATSILMGSGLTDAKGNIIGKSLAERFADVGFKGTEENLKLLNEYMLALHSLYRDREGKPVFDNHITKEDRKAFIMDVLHNHPDVAKAEAQFQAFRREFLQEFLVNTGRLSQEAFDNLNRIYPHYVPTFRVKSTDGIAQRTGKGKTFKIQRAKGSTEDIYNPFDSFCGMVNTIVSQNALNRAAQTFDRMYQTHEGLGMFARQIPKGEEEKAVTMSDLTNKQAQVYDLVDGLLDADTMAELLRIVGNNGFTQENVNSHDTLKVVRDDGTVVEYQFEDMELFKLLAGVNNKSSNAALDALGFITRGMSALTTGSNPIFAARNFMRDFQNSVNYGSWASNYGTGVFKWLKSAYEVWKESDDYKDYVALGGGGWTRIDPSRQASRNELYSGIFEGYDTSNVGKTLKWAGKKVWNAVTLARVNEVIEQASRFAEYKYGQHDLETEEGRLEAYLAGQEATVDFNRAGNSNLATMLKKLVPFFNASTQGVYRTGRMFTEAERDRAPARFAKTVINTAIMSALSSAILLGNMDDDDKEEFAMLSDDLKSKHFYLPNFAPEIFGESPLLRIPLAQDPLTYAIHGAVTNLMWNGQTEDPMVIDLAAIADTIMDNLNPIGSGTILAPILAVASNKSWYGSRIVPSYLERNKYAPDQYTEETANVFVDAARALHEMTDGKLSLSPMKLQYLAEQYTGFLGQLVIPAISKQSNGELGGVKAAINAARKRFTSDPLTSNDVVSSFYDGADILNSVIEETNQGKPLNILRRGLTQDEAGQAYEEAKSMTSGVINQTKQQINDLYNEIDQINENSTLSDHDKYELTSQRRKKIVELALDANEKIGEYKEKYVTGSNMTTRMLLAGSESHKPTAIEKMPDTFKEDTEDKYMQKALEVYNDENSPGYQNGAALPHPSTTFTAKNRKGEEVEYTISDEEYNKYAEIYKKEYSAYLDRKGSRWNQMSGKEKYDLLKAAAASANKKMKEAYVSTH